MTTLHIETPLRNPPCGESGTPVAIELEVFQAQKGDQIGTVRRKEEKTPRVIETDGLSED
tara:strand:- start:898 stop:1077 length:180 start_codon:yes stop_codon:yes gene_type:complete